MAKTIDIASLLEKKHRHRIAIKNWPSLKSSPFRSEQSPGLKSLTRYLNYLFGQVFPSSRQTLEELFLGCLNLESVSRLHDLWNERLPGQSAFTPVYKAEGQVLQVTPTRSASKMGIPEKCLNWRKIVNTEQPPLNLLKYSIVPSWALRGSGFSSLCAFSSP